jgi:hypothetical protein
MLYNSAYLLRLISLVDLPNYEAVVNMAKRAGFYPKLIRPLAGAALAYLLLKLFKWGDHEIIIISATIGISIFVINFLDQVGLAIAERHSEKISKVLAGIGLFAGIGITLMLKSEPLIILAAGAGGFFLGWLIFIFGLLVLRLVVGLLSILFHAFCSPISIPILSLFAYFNRYGLRKKHKEWFTSTGNPIVEFGRDGVKYIHHNNEPIFVSSSRFRTGGLALASGIPLFTLTELSNSAIVNQRMATALAILKTDRIYDEVPESNMIESYNDAGALSHPLLDINPASGLPMLDGIGGIDVAGNTFGNDSSMYEPMIYESNNAD